jgi:hypothetical protein
MQSVPGSDVLHSHNILYNFDQLFAGCATRHTVRGPNCSQHDAMRDILFADL